MALTAPSPGKRLRYAQAGLAVDGSAGAPDIHVLLLRQLYLAYLERDELGHAVDTARKMARVGPLKDVAHHDAARALAALGNLEAAIAEQRLATRSAPAARRSFQLWSLGTLQHFAHDFDGAVATLRRAERWAQRDRALVLAHAAWVELDAGTVPQGLPATITALERSEASKGYGAYLLGMIAHAMGDHGNAVTHLRAFLRRNAAADRAKALTLHEELRRARTVLAELDSD